MNFDISRDFLDGLNVTHPPAEKAEGEVKVNGGLHFLPSSPDHKLHTVIVLLSISLGDENQAFARGGWRFLYTTDQPFNAKEQAEHRFHKQLLMLGASKLITIFNGTFLHANMPVIPVDPSQIAQASRPTADQSGSPSQPQATVDGPESTEGEPDPMQP